MPNHTQTIFRVTGTPEKLEEFIKRAAFKEKDGSETIFSFGSFVPCPPEIKHMTCPTKIVTEEELKKEEEDNAARIAKAKAEGKSEDYVFITHSLTEEMAKQYMQRFGALNWYDWQVRNWGTKWDCYEQSNEWERVSKNENGTTVDYIQMMYQTAWSPASSAILSISEMFPDLMFYHEFADEGGGFLGSETIQDGEILAQQDLEWNSEEGKEMRVRLYGPEEEEEEEVEE